MQNELASHIPEKIKKEIVEKYGIEKEIYVYRVLKWGKIEEKAFYDSYKEREMEGRQKNVKPESVGDYSTSCFTDVGPCNKYIKLLKGRYSEFYPQPAVAYGVTKYGLVQRTIERELEYDEEFHVDWWIYVNGIEKLIKDECFKVIGDDDE